MENLTDYSITINFVISLTNSKNKPFVSNLINTTVQSQFSDIKFSDNL